MNFPLLQGVHKIFLKKSHDSHDFTRHFWYDFQRLKEFPMTLNLYLLMRHNSQVCPYLKWKIINQTVEYIAKWKLTIANKYYECLCHWILVNTTWWMLQACKQFKLQLKAAKIQIRKSAKIFVFTQKWDAGDFTS